MGYWGVKNDRTGSGKAMETLPGPKTAIKNKQNPSIGRKFENRDFSYFPRGGLPIFQGEHASLAAKMYRVSLIGMGL